MANKEKIELLNESSSVQKNNPNEINNADAKNVPSNILIIRGNRKNNQKFDSDNNSLSCCVDESMNFSPNWLIADYKIIKLTDAINFIEHWNKRSLYSNDDGEIDDENDNDDIEKRDVTKNDLKIDKMKEQLHKYSLAQEWKRKAKKKAMQRENFATSEKSENSEEKSNDDVDNKPTCCMKNLQSFARNKTKGKKTKSPSKIVKTKGLTYDKKSGIVNCIHHTEITTVKSDTSFISNENVKCSKSYIIHKGIPKVTSTQTQVICCSSKAVGTDGEEEKHKGQRQGKVMIPSKMSFGVKTKNSSCQTESTENENENDMYPLQSKHFSGRLYQNNVCNVPDYSNCNMNHRNDNNFNNDASWKNCNSQINQQQYFNTNAHAPAAMDMTCSTYYKNYNFNYSTSNIGIPMQLTTSSFEGNHQFYNNNQTTYLNYDNNNFQKNADLNMPYSYIYSSYNYPCTYIP